VIEFKLISHGFFILDMALDTAPRASVSGGNEQAPLAGARGAVSKCCLHIRAGMYNSGS